MLKAQCRSIFAHMLMMLLHSQAEHTVCRLPFGRPHRIQFVSPDLLFRVRRLYIWQLKAGEKCYPCCNVFPTILMLLCNFKTSRFVVFASCLLFHSGHKTPGKLGHACTSSSCYLEGWLIMSAHSCLVPLPLLALKVLGSGLCKCTHMSTYAHRSQAVQLSVLPATRMMYQNL